MERTCKCCDKNVIKDEYHFLFDRRLYENLRSIKKIIIKCNNISNKNNKIENLRKVFKQRTLDSIKNGKFIRRNFESRNAECQQLLSYTIKLQKMMK